MEHPNSLGDFLHGESSSLLRGPAVGYLGYQQPPCPSGESLLPCSGGATCILHSFPPSKGLPPGPVIYSSYLLLPTPSRLSAYLSSRGFFLLASRSFLKIPE